MHDRISADYYKLNPTGNGRRESYAHYPLPRMTTTYLANGDTDPETSSVPSKKEFTVLHSVAVRLTFPTGILFLSQPLHGLLKMVVSATRSRISPSSATDLMPCRKSVWSVMILPSVRAFGPAEKMVKVSRSEWDSRRC